MEGVPYDWNDYLSSEGLSDIATTGLGMQGGQSGQDGPPIHEWHDQQLASRHKSYNADESQGYSTAEPSSLDHEEDLSSFAHDYEPIASQDLYRHHCTTSRLETSGPGSDPAPPEQAPSSILSPIETGPDAFTQEVHDLGAFSLDHVCACATCLEWNSNHRDLLRRCRDEHPESESWYFGCRVTGCQWTEKNNGKRYSNLDSVRYHESERSHYGKCGDWRCREANCKYVTKRWGDLKRHYSSKHCINPQSFECPVLGCKYHQDGFTRKDKLNSHYEKVHGGKSRPGKSNQAIKPKIGDCA